MAAIESVVAVTEGAGKSFRTLQRSISSVNVEEQSVLVGEPYKTTYSIIASSISTATAASHILQIMAGTMLYTRIEKIRVKQVTNAGGVAMLALQAFRLTSAGTGGTAITARPHDSADAAFSGAAMTLPAVKGTEGVQLDLFDFPLRAAIVANEQEHVWTLPEDVKPWIIPNGAANGICFKAAAGVAASTISIVVTVTETAFL